MIAVRGAGSAIARALATLTSDKIHKVPRGETNVEAERHLFCQGLLRPKPLTAQTAAEVAESWEVNFAMVARQCDAIFEKNDRARVCVIGSESGFAGSFDGAYALAKAAVHRYVETKRLRSRHQQLICIAPGIIEDAGMTTRRSDRDHLARRAMAHPKLRFVTAHEVATLVNHVLYVDAGYLSGVVIRMNGGEHIR